MAERKIPMRRCVGCQEMKPKKELIRIVHTEYAVEVDATGRKNGRGAYLCASLACLKRAQKNRGLERSLKTAVSAEVYEDLEKEMSALES